VCASSSLMLTGLPSTTCSSLEPWTATPSDAACWRTHL
jgi:hypothetical protein